MSSAKNRENPTQEELKHLLREVGERLGFEVVEEWSPQPLRGDRASTYVPRIDLVWLRRSSEGLVHLIRETLVSMSRRTGMSVEEMNVIPKYRDPSVETVICFELELTDRSTKYLLGDISNLSRICDLGFVIVTGEENLTKRACKTTISFSTLHGSSNVLVLGPEEAGRLLMEILGSTKQESVEGDS